MELNSSSGKRKKKRTKIGSGLLDRFDFLDLGHFLLEEVLDALLERHLVHGAACTMTQQPNFDGAFLEADVLDVASVHLKLGADFVKRSLDFFLDGFRHIR